MFQTKWIQGLLALTLTLGSATVAIGDDGCGGGCCEGGEQKAAAKADGGCCGEAGESPLGRLAELQGEWVSGDANQDGKPDVTVTYRLTAGGSALIETIMPGTPQEMVTVYTRDGEGWVLTHYCHIGNQPRMRGAPVAGSTAIAELAFTFVDGTNMQPTDAHMHAMHITFTETGLRHEWSFFQDGVEKQKVSFDLTRVATTQRS
jgi:hypothetical protein